MRSQEAFNDLRHFVDLLNAHGLLADSNAIVRNHRGSKEVVSWSESPDLVLGYDATGVGYGEVALSEYRRLVAQRHFLALLTDFSFFQTTFTFVNEELVHSRLCFFPCPIDTTPEVLGEFLSLILAEHGLDGLIAELEGSPPDLARCLRLVTPVRVDFDPEAPKKIPPFNLAPDGDDAEPGHSASHLTILRSTCRIPLHAPTSMGHFVRLVFRHFYTQVWRDSKGLRLFTLRRLDRTVTQSEETEIHLECRQAL